MEFTALPSLVLFIIFVIIKDARHVLVPFYFWCTTLLYPLWDYFEHKIFPWKTIRVKLYQPQSLYYLFLRNLTTKMNWLAEAIHPLSSPGTIAGQISGSKSGHNPSLNFRWMLMSSLSGRFLRQRELLIWSQNKMRMASKYPSCCESICALPQHFLNPITVSIVYTRRRIGGQGIFSLSTCL